MPILADSFAAIGFFVANNILIVREWLGCG